MNKERRVNIIKALKNELHRYKRARVQYVINQHTYDHLRLCRYIPYEDVITLEESELMDIAKHGIAKTFLNSLGEQIPIYVEDEERMCAKKVIVDIFVRG